MDGRALCRGPACKLPTSTGCETSYNSVSFTSCCWSDYQLLPSSLQALWSWIVKARAAVRKSLNSRFNCRKRQVPDGIPAARQDHSWQAPILFGSLWEETSDEIWHGVHFLTVHAIHIEVVHNLETDSLLNSMHCFIARRGIQRRWDWIMGGILCMEKRSWGVPLMGGTRK